MIKELETISHPSEQQLIQARITNGSSNLQVKLEKGTGYLHKLLNNYKEKPSEWELCRY